MTSPALGARIYGSSGSAVAGRFVGGLTFEQIGDTQTLEKVSASADRNGSVVVDFRGEVYWWLGGTIYRLDAGTDTWTTTGGHIFATPPGGTGNSGHGGLYKALTTAGEVLVGMYVTGANNIRMITFDGTTFTETASALASTPFTNVDECVFNNQLYCFRSASTANVYALNPETLGISVIAVTGGSSTNGARSIVALGANLYVLSAVTSGGRAGIYQLIGGVFTFLTVLTTAGTSIPATAGSVLFADPSLSSLIAIVYNDLGTPEGFEAYQIDFSGGSPVVTDRTAAMLPSAFQAANDPGLNVRALAYVDPNPADPTSPEIYVYMGFTETGQRQLFRYTNPTTELTDLGPSDVTGEFVIPRRRDAIGDYIFTPRTGGVDQDGISIEGYARADGGVEVSFRGFRNAGSADRTVTFFYRTGQNTPAIQATLVASSVTGGTATNTTSAVSSVDPDGAILYTVIWDNFTDGVPSGDQFTMEAKMVRP